MQRVWDKLASLPRLGDVAEIHRGIEYKLSLEENENKLVSDIPREGLARGLRQVTDDFEPYTASSSTYLNMNPALMRREAYKLPWDKPKVIANAARRTMAGRIAQFQRFRSLLSRSDGTD